MDLDVDTVVRVVLADDHPIVLAGVKTLLENARGIELVGEASDGLTAVRLAHEANPDIAVIDLSLPKLSGIDLAQRLHEECPNVRVIALTVHEDLAYVQPLMQAGARGYVLKRSAAEDLVRAIRAVADGGVYLDPAIATKALGEKAPGAQLSEAALSPREETVLRLTAEGFSNKEIAGRLNVSVKSVETYKARAADKLNLRSRAQIVKYAMAQGWLNAPSGSGA